MRRITWSRQAQSDLAAIHHHFQSIDPDYVHRVAAEVRGAAEFLLDYPKAGQIVAGRDTRKWRVARTPYLVFYRPTDSGLRALRILHAARDWASFL